MQKQKKYDSELILGTSFDPITEKLTVRYVDGHVYDYYHVPPDLVRALERAKSAGHFWVTRRSHFSHRRIS
jgi:hypothetical protein